MKNNSNVTKISDFTNDQHLDDAWKKVISILNRVVTLDSMMPKSLQRSNKHLALAIHELIEALITYDLLKEKVK